MNRNFILLSWFLQNQPRNPILRVYSLYQSYFSSPFSAFKGMEEREKGIDPYRALHYCTLCLVNICFNLRIFVYDNLKVLNILSHWYQPHKISQFDRYSNKKRINQSQITIIGYRTSAIRGCLHKNWPDLFKAGVRVRYFLSVGSGSFEDGSIWKSNKVENNIELYFLLHRHYWTILFSLSFQLFIIKIEAENPSRTLMIIKFRN